jgi:hypothetical protein
MVESDSGTPSGGDTGGNSTNKSTPGI